MSSFVHLHTHSHYSLLEASCRPSDIAATAAKLGMPAVAITDNGNMFGAIEFYFACKKNNVKPIIGLDAYLAPINRFTKNEKKDPNYKPNTRLVLLAKDIKGYRKLCKISSSGYQEGFYYKPRVDLELLEELKGDFFVLTGGATGDVMSRWSRQGREEAEARLLALKNIFGSDLFLEIQRTQTAPFVELDSQIIELSKSSGVPLVASNNVHYLQKDDQLGQEVLICIGSNRTLHDDARWKLGSSEFYFKSSEQMEDIFKDIPEALENTLKIAEQCNIKFELEDSEGKPIYHLPTFPTQGGNTVAEEIRRLTLEGLDRRFDQFEKAGRPVPEDKKSVYFERLDYELGVITEMGFIGYFLIVQDFIKWAKTSGIPVGPGRGSGAGSLVAYTLEITDLDPVRYSLIFERFLNPERVSMPDFDIDFCQEKRGQVIEYVTEKYGKDSVSQIITYGKLQARAAIRDVGRVLGMTYGEVDVVAKLVPDKLGINLKEALEMEPRFQEQMEMDPQVNNLMTIAQKIEGLVRHAGIHAAGVVIADGQLVSHAPLYRGLDGENVIQYDMKHAEKIGLIKFDFLGLKTLTHIQYALDLVEKNRGVKLEASEINIDDPEIYKLMSAGDSAGVFQFEGDGITDALKKIKPECFEDIMAINALYRPGPMDMIPEYTRRKHGKSSVDYIFPELEEILKETYGVIIYQEQVQLIASKIASYSLGEADLLRRAMGKKIAEEMDQQRERFLKGAIENQFNEKKAAKLFDLMAEFAKYGFNKSHSAAYCVIAAQTAWIKSNYPIEFYAALLSTDLNDTDKIVKYIKLCRRRGIDIQAPHINFSDYKFNVKGETLYYSLAALKGVGQSAVEAIIEARNSLEAGAFQSIEEFFETVDLRRVNKKVIECLIKAGAFKGLGFSRAQLFEGYSQFVEAAERKQKDAEVGQASLFSLNEEQMEQEKVSLPQRRPWAKMTRLNYEKEVLGFFLSDHPLRGFEKIAKSLATDSVLALKDQNHKKRVMVVGMVTEIREIITKKGTRMAFAKIEDLSEAVELIVFPDTFSSFESQLKTEVPVIVTGTLENKENEACKIITEKIAPVGDSLRSIKEIQLSIEPKMVENLDKLQKSLKEHPGKTRVKMKLLLKEIGKNAIFEIKEPQGIQLSHDFLDGLQYDFGDLSFLEVTR